MTGFVSLVGAGPGDPDLLTVKAARRIAEAEVLLHDALVSNEILALSRCSHRVDVGKRAGRASASQETIHGLLLRAAGRGKRVVRLKCGDPFVFGRGGEEALALAAARIPFEVIPGISSALAAPALAGIPVTHRGLASGFVVVSGHAEAVWRPLLTGIAPGSMTIVVMMGLAGRGRIAQALLASGWNTGTPAAVLLGASGVDAYAWRGTLRELGAAPLPDGSTAPGTLCIGAVVSLAGTLGVTVERGQTRPARRAGGR
jgi:uroporphyrin-III C-methyltransferase/precorrin-2 dehydrogenase/sirohydrochlorin ferrochelatase